MGLDVYLHHYDDFAARIKFEDLRSDEETRLLELHWSDYALVDLKLAEWEAAQGTVPLPPEHIELDSELYPNHSFQIGYFRSAYNDNGFNSVFCDTINKSLYDIFQPGNNYAFVPDWVRASYIARSMQDNFALHTKQASSNMKFYTEAIAIVIETINWVLNQKTPNKYALHWSA
jgi:hypothetical protein